MSGVSLEEGSGAAERDETVAPSASATCRHAAKCGVERGRGRTRGRTERTTWAPSLIGRVGGRLGAGARRAGGTQPQLLHERWATAANSSSVDSPRDGAARAVGLQGHRASP